MAILNELPEPEWSDWLESRPEKIRDLAREFPPNKLYRLKSSGHRVTIISYSQFDDGKVGFMVEVSGDFNFVAFERHVFGIPADGLEECELPPPYEQIGSANVAFSTIIHTFKDREN